MGFWLFMFCMNLLIPVSMWIVGIGYSKGAGKINPLMGYRTPMSIKNDDTWQFAHKCLSRIWKKCGLGMLVVSVIGGLLVAGKSEDVVGTVIGGMVLVQTVIILVTIIPVEKALNKTFDKNGERKVQSQEIL